MFNAEGNLAYFLGGQINCSTTVHSSSDILRVLSLSEDIEGEKEREQGSGETTGPGRKGFMSRFRTHRSDKRLLVREAGMEQGLLNQLEKKNLRKQMETFWAAYSKYMVLACDTLHILFYSLGVVDLLGFDEPIVGKDVFKVLGQHATTISRDFKSKVREPLAAGRAVSIDVNLLDSSTTTRTMDVRFITHWTPLKDEDGAVTAVILTLASTIR